MSERHLRAYANAMAPGWEPTRAWAVLDDYTSEIVAVQFQDESGLVWTVDPGTRLPGWAAAEHLPYAWAQDVQYAGLELCDDDVLVWREQNDRIELVYTLKPGIFSP